MLSTINRTICRPLIALSSISVVCKSDTEKILWRDLFSLNDWQKMMTYSNRKTNILMFLVKDSNDEDIAMRIELWRPSICLTYWINHRQNWKMQQTKTSVYKTPLVMLAPVPQSRKYFLTIENKPADVGSELTKQTKEIVASKAIVNATSIIFLSIRWR